MADPNQSLLEVKDLEKNVSDISSEKSHNIKLKIHLSFFSFYFQEYILKQVASMYLKLGWPTNNLNRSLIQAPYQHEYCYISFFVSAIDSCTKAFT